MKLFRIFAALFLFSPLAVLAQMEQAEVEQVLRQAALRARVISPQSVIAVVDREGYVLGVWAVGKVPTGPAKTKAVAAAVSKAGTAAFLSSGGEALTSRSAGFIVQQHFPPQVNNKPPGPLVGVNFSNLPFSDINFLKDPRGFVPRPASTSGPGGTNGFSIKGTSLAGAPGGVPLYKNGVLIGGVGVTVDGTELLRDIQGLAQVYNIHEDIARAGQLGYAPPAVIEGSNIFIDGIRLPDVASSTIYLVPPPLSVLGAPVLPFAPTNSPSVTYPLMMFGGVLGEVRAPIRADPTTGKISGQLRLNAVEVALIIAKAAERARTTRGGIRLPAGTAAQVFITVVGNPASPGKKPPVLGVFRTPDATIFSWDVSVQKARTALFFSSNQRAFSTRTVGFMAQRFYPPGISGTVGGPFLGMQERFSGFVGLNTLNKVNITQAPTTTPPNPNVPNGITIFPGGFPLYRNGVLIGAIGISGDGVDQDDLIGAAGTVNYLPRAAIRADAMIYRGARLPYAKFPRNPEL